MTLQRETILPNDTICWSAIETRDASYDGLVFYGVRSTGIYCRPSCSSRLPKRENVMFFAAPGTARQAGFRACLRCHPEAETSQNPQAVLVKQLCRQIESDSDHTSDLATLSVASGLSASHLQRLFKKLMGITPRQYAETLRLKAFKTAVKAGSGVTEAIYDAGYGSSSRLYEKAEAQLGMTPATYQRGGKGMTIDFTIAECSLGDLPGHLLVARTERGICSVTLGDEAEMLSQTLREEFPNAQLARNDAALRETVNAILAHLAGYAQQLDLPLDVRATAFQRLVWEELRRIPYGSTVSYSGLAKRIGNPAATRAVARACATNPVALLTPCHRVVRENGDLSGYRWGVERKKKLLEQERRFTE